MATRIVQKDLYPREVCAVLVPGGVQDMVSWNIPCPCQEGWNKKIFEVPSKPKHSVILGFWDSMTCAVVRRFLRVGSSQIRWSLLEFYLVLCQHFLAFLHRSVEPKMGMWLEVLSNKKIPQSPLTCIWASLIIRVRDKWTCMKWSPLWMEIQNFHWILVLPEVNNYPCLEQSSFG